MALISKRTSAVDVPYAGANENANNEYRAVVRTDSLNVILLNVLSERLLKSVVIIKTSIKNGTIIIIVSPREKGSTDVIAASIPRIWFEIPKLKVLERVTEYLVAI